MHIQHVVHGVLQFRGGYSASVYLFVPRRWWIRIQCSRAPYPFSLGFYRRRHTLKVTGHPDAQTGTHLGQQFLQSTCSFPIVLRLFSGGIDYHAWLETKLESLKIKVTLVVSSLHEFSLVSSRVAHTQPTRTGVVQVKRIHEQCPREEQVIQMTVGMQFDAFLNQSAKDSSDSGHDRTEPKVCCENTRRSSSRSGLSTRSQRCQGIPLPALLRRACRCCSV